MWFSMYAEEKYKTIINEVKRSRFLHFTQTGKMLIPVDYDKVGMCI